MDKKLASHLQHHVVYPITVLLNVVSLLLYPRPGVPDITTLRSGAEDKHDLEHLRRLGPQI